MTPLSFLIDADWTIDFNAVAHVTRRIAGLQLKVGDTSDVASLA